MVKNKSEEGGSVGKVLALQAWDPELESQHPHENLGMVTCSCSPHTGKTQVEPWKFLNRLSVLVDNLWVPVKHLPSKKARVWEIAG